MDERRHHRMTQTARMLRKNMTREEKHLWYDFLRYYPVRFYRQRVIGPYIVDFFCHRAQLVIELDGSGHYTEAGRMKDEGRKAFLERRGLLVIRYTNRIIREQFSLVCDQIEDIVKKRSSTLSF